MKNILRLSALILFISLIAGGCKKDETKVLFAGGTPPVLSADQSELVLTKDNATQTAVTFSWTNPGYSFNTGVSSQDVSYILQVDTAGADFTSPSKQEISISKDLSKTFTVTDINTVLGKLDLLENVPHNVEFRLYSSLGNNSVRLYSNVVSMVITPYLDVAVPLPPTGELYITGNAVPSDWTNSPPETQKCEMVSKVEYSIVVDLAPGKQYKFLSTLTQWQPQYGITKDAGNSASSGLIGFNMGNGSDPDAFNTPADAGSYKVDLNFKTGKYTVTKQ